MNETQTAIIVVDTQKEHPLITAAKNGLYSELSDLSVAMYARAVDDFLAYMKEHESDEFGKNIPVALSAFLRHLTEQGLKPSSIRNKKGQICRFFEWMERVGAIDQKTYLDIKRIKTPKVLGSKAGKWLNAEQLTILLNAPDTSTVEGRRDKAILALLVGCALRRGDVVNLTWGNLDRYGDTYVITNLVRKHGRMQAYIPVPDSVMKSITNYSSRGKDDECVIKSYTKNYRNTRKSITTDAIWRIVRKYCDQLGFGAIAPHDLRRSAARYYKISKGVSLDQLAIVMGHSSAQTTAKYVNEILDIDSMAKSFDLDLGLDD